MEDGTFIAVVLAILLALFLGVAAGRNSVVYKSKDQGIKCMESIQIGDTCRELLNISKENL